MLVPKRLWPEIGLILALGILAWLSRLPFQPQWLDSFDAVNYALAVDHFDVRFDQPQPPGYYLYILGVRAMNVLTQDPARALFHFSSLASALGVIGIYLAGREMFGRRTGLVAALLLSTSTVFWYQSEIASPYTGDLTLSVFVGWLCYRARKTQRTGDLLLAALLLGISGAYRPQTLVFLAPLLLYALWGRSWKLWLLCGAVVAVSAGMLFYPAIVSSGGLKAYLRAVLGMKGTVVTGHQVQYGSRRYLGYIVTTLKHTFLAIGELAMLLVLVGFIRQLFKRQMDVLLFLMLWVLPTWLVFCLLYPGNPGTILVCIPSFFLWAGSSFERPLTMRWQKIGFTALGAILVWQTVLFVGLPYKALGERYRTFSNASYIRLVDRYVEDLFALVDEFPADDTIVMVYKNWRHLQYYRPEYVTYSRPFYTSENPTELLYILEFYQGQTKARSHIPVQNLIPPDTRRLLLLEMPQEQLSASAPWLEERSRNGISIYVIDIPTDRQAVWTSDGVILAPRQ